MYLSSLHKFLTRHKPHLWGVPQKLQAKQKGHVNPLPKAHAKHQYQDKGFIFCDGNGRTKIREIDNRIRKLCNKAGIEEKSAHDIRRTVASEMFAKGVSPEIIRNFLGHSDIKTTFGYILDNQKKEDTHRQILSSLNNLNGLKPFKKKKATTLHKHWIVALIKKSARRDSKYTAFRKHA